MLRSPILLILLLVGCGDQPLDPAARAGSARAINLSGLPGEISIWMDGEVIASGLADTQPSAALSIRGGTHTFAYSSGGELAPKAAVDFTVPEESFSLVALMPGTLGPELRLFACPEAPQGRITVRALNASDEPARIILRGRTGAPGGVEATLDVDAGSFGQSDLPGVTFVRVGNTQNPNPTEVSILTGRASDPLEDFQAFQSLELGLPISGDVRTVIFHRSPTFAPDVYSF